MTRSRSSSVSSSSGKPSAMVRPAPLATPPTLRHKISSALLGEKGSSVPGYVVGTSKSLRVQVGGEKQENPAARLKLLLIASFLTLHILNLITPLTPSRTTTHPTPPHVAGVNVRKVDITASGIRSVLQSLVDASSVNFESSDGDATESDGDSTPFELLVKIPPPIYIRVLPPAYLLPARIGLLEGEHLTGRGSTGEWLESFMSSWTRLVGDPILSKWIVVVLAISISLNGYLLKGIALGVGVRAFGVVGRSGVVKGGVRFDEDEEVQQQSTAVVVAKLAPASPTRGPTSPAPAPSSVATFSLEDVDRKLKATKRLSSTSTKPSAAQPLSPSDSDPSSSSSENEGPQEAKPDAVRSLEECVDIFENGPRPQSVALSMLNDEEVVLLAQHGKIAAYALEKVLGMDELERAVRIRRALISRASLTQTLETSDIPMANYDYSRVLGACCENVVGYIPIPLGIAGPLNVDGTLYPIPMATAEGTLVASTSRGCKALNAGGGVTTVVVQDAMTRGPAIDFPNIVMASEAKAWIASEEGYNAIKTAFESTSRFAKLKSLKTAMAGRTLFVRFATATGDAMGMNMISKGTEKGLEVMQKHFPEMVVLALSGNYCTDKKPAAINWIEGRGKSVVAEAVIPGKVVKTVLKTTVEALCNLNTKKNLVGSAMAGSIGGFNAHAANILTAMFLATGQDPAQNVESSNCMTLMEPVNKGEDLLMTITMPSIEVGTVGGGTVLAPQQGVLELLGMKGAHPTAPGQNAQALARLIAAAVMAGELSLLSALAAGHLIRAHMAHNRSQTNTPAPSLPPTPAPGAGPAFAGQLALPAKRKGSLGAQLGPLTPSSSTGSLPPYSARP